MSRRKTHEEFVDEMLLKHPDIELLGTYTGAHNRIRCRCKIDGTEWEPKAYLLSDGKGCRECGYRRASSKLQNSFETEKRSIEEKNPNIEVLERVFDRYWKVRCRCRIDGYEWVTKARNILVDNNGCARCSQKEKKTTELFINELATVNCDIEVIGEYSGTHAKIACRCLKDGFEWSATPRNLLTGWGCPRCRLSRGEKRIASYLQTKSIDFKQQFAFDECRDEHVLLFDFYIPSLNMAIEFDGEQHFRPVKFGGINDKSADERFAKTKLHDDIKNNYCAQNNIKLLRIDYTEFEDIENILDKHLL